MKAIFKESQSCTIFTSIIYPCQSRVLYSCSSEFRESSVMTFSRVTKDRLLNFTGLSTSDDCHANFYRQLKESLAALAANGGLEHPYNPFY